MLIDLCCFTRREFCFRITRIVVQLKMNTHQRPGEVRSDLLVYCHHQSNKRMVSVSFLGNNYQWLCLFTMQM